jgi:hypothetical protein
MSSSSTAQMVLTTKVWEECSLALHRLGHGRGESIVYRKPFDAFHFQLLTCFLVFETTVLMNLTGNF